ncbi:unnamed protein product [Protopolystoma xenopodis]|uniref:Uncharacterized protein n=1 Tax=Protopolystoma xenopodis TaxID=117903 RepID=A0A3S5A7Z9_9PLAT|nr:unnamed protein product [Protopolystoma xenopodis]
MLPAEDFAPPELVELLFIGNWVHYRPCINRQGRCNWVTKARSTRAFTESLEEGQIMADELIDLVRISAGDTWFRRQLKQRMENGSMQLANMDVNTVEEIGAWLTNLYASKANDEGLGEEGNEDEEVDLEEPEEMPGILGPIDEDAPLVPIGHVGLPDGRLGNLAVRKSGSSGGASGGSALSRGQISAAGQPLPAWRSRASTVLLPSNCTITIISNNRWPGANTLAKGALLLNRF